MNLTALKTWVSGETLTASDLNAEYQNIYNHTITNSDIDSTGTYVLGELVVGSGITAADGGQLHVHTASAGSVSAHADANEAVLENSAASGLSILSGSSSDGNIFFGDAADNDIGKIAYSHSANSLAFTTNGTTALTLSSAQAATFAGDVNVGGALTLTGGISLNGNTTIGNSASDTLTVTATITSNLIFTDNTYDIGASGATRPRDLHLSRNALMGGTLGVTGLLTATAGVTSGSNIVSDTDGTDDLGTTSVRWANLYADSIGDSGQALAVKATTLSFDAASTIDTSGNNNLTLDAGTATLTLDANTIESDASTLSFDAAATIDTSGNNNLSLDAGTATLTLDAGTIESDAGTLSFDAAASIDTSGNNALAIDTGSANLNVTAGTLALTGAQTISSTLGVSGLITASGGVSGALTGDVTGNISGNVTGGTISGTTGTFSSTLAVTGATTLSSDVGIGTSASATNRLTLSGNQVILASGELKFADAANASVGMIKNANSNGSQLDFITGSTAMTILSDANVGIGTSSPQRPLHIDGTEGVARFTSTASGNNGLEVGIGTSSQAFIWQAENSYLQFATNNAERLRIDNAGNMGLGLTPSTFSVGTAFEVGGAGNALWYSGSTGDIILRSNVYYDSGDKYGANGHATQIKMNNSGAFEFYTAPSGTANATATLSKRASIDSDGLKFGSATAAANALDSYEEGTYSVTDQSGAGLSFSVNSNRYIKIGKLVFITIEFFFPTTSDGTSARISLPFANNTTQRGAMSVITNRSDVQLGAYLSTLSSAFSLTESAASPTSVTNASLSGKYLIISGCYEATA